MAATETSASKKSFDDRRPGFQGLVLSLGKRLRKRLFGFFARQSKIGDLPVFPSNVFSWTADLEAQWQAIRAELEVLLRYRNLLPPFQEISPDNGRIAVAERWRVFMFYGFGVRSDRNCTLCPTTARLLGSIPGITSAWFSIMSPRYHVPRHRGVSKSLVRCHLGLVIPPEPDKCRMQVGGTMNSWTEGRCLVFDDTRRHEVWNDTDQERVVLLLDVERPMRWFGRFVSKLFLFGVRRSAYFRDAARNQKKWEDHFHREFERLRLEESARTPQPAAAAGRSPA